VKFTGLHARHNDAGAKMVPFGGWEMPIAYPTGTIEEHLRCRSGCVMFDVSHLGTVRVQGSEAFAQLQRTLTNDLAKVAPGRAQYTHLLDADDASVLDDIIVWWVAEGVFDVMPNASNTERVIDAIGGIDTTAERCIIAVQGPTARNVLSLISQEAANVPRFAVREVMIAGAVCVVAGTGYTGEDGVEIAVGGLAIARTRVGTRNHAFAGESRMGRGLEERDLSWAIGVDGRKRARRHQNSERCGHRRSPSASRRKCRVR